MTAMKEVCSSDSSDYMITLDISVMEMVEISEFDERTPRARYFFVQVNLADDRKWRYDCLNELLLSGTAKRTNVKRNLKGSSSP